MSEPKEQLELFDYDETHNINLESFEVMLKDLGDFDIEKETSPDQCDLTTFWESENK